MNTWCDNVFCLFVFHPRLQSPCCIIHMYSQRTACWSTLRYSYLMTPTMHLRCNWYTALHKQTNKKTLSWLSEQTIAVKMIFKWFVQDMDIINSTVITQPPLCRPPSIITHLSATDAAFCFYPNSHLCHSKALHQIIVVMWQSCLIMALFLKFSFQKCLSLLELGQFYDLKPFQSPVL